MKPREGLGNMIHQRASHRPCDDAEEHEYSIAWGGIEIPIPAWIGQIYDEVPKAMRRELVLFGFVLGLVTAFLAFLFGFYLSYI